MQHKRIHHIKPDKPISKRMAWHATHKTLNVHPKNLILRSGRCHVVGKMSQARARIIFGD